MSAGARAVRALSAAIDRRDWDALADLLAPGFTCTYLHTGERLDAEGYLRLNREYPGGPWSFDCQDVVAHGDRAAAHARVGDGTQTYHVALFVTASDDRLLDLVELWTDAVTPAPGHRPA